MRRLGAILAGGRSSRFGGDKGAVEIDGRSLIDLVAGGLRPQVAMLAVVGRDWPGLHRVDDAPAAGLGPLGGLCGALQFAAAEGFDHVVVQPCDLLPVPDWSAVEVGAVPVFAAGHFASGVWPASMAAALNRHLSAAQDRSVRGWIEVNGARAVECGPMFDLNTRAALRRYSESGGGHP